VTQLRKLGTIMTAEAVDGLEGRRSYEIHTLLGRRDDALLDVYARQLIEKIALTSAKPLLLTIALAEDGRGVDVFNDVLNTVLQIATW
jgi:proteasome assembly chaperone 3